MFASNFPDRMLDKSSFQATENFDNVKLSDENQFDYGLLDTEARIVAKQRASEIKSLMQQNSQNIIEIGQKLIDVKEQMEHGQFGRWLKAEFDWSKSAALRFMQVASQFKNTNLAHLEIAPSALYEIAAPSTPEGARQEIIERAKQGEKITYTKAKSISAHHKPFKLKEAKQVTVDTPAETVEREASSESFENPVKAQHTDAHSSMGSERFTEVEPIRYATPSENAGIGNDELELEETKENNQDVAAEQQGEGELLPVVGFVPLEQEYETETSLPQLEQDAKDQVYEATVYSAEGVEVQAVEVAEELEPESAESVRKTVNDDYHIVEPAKADLEALLEVVGTGDPDEHLATSNTAPLVSEPGDIDNRPQNTLHKLYCIVSLEALEYAPESTDLKFSEFDEAAKVFTMSTEFITIVDALNQEECEEVFEAIAHRIPPAKVVDFFSVEQLFALNQAIASRISDNYDQ